LRPPKMTTRQGSASNGPVVMLNASDSECAALVVTSTGIKHVALPGMTFSGAKDLAEAVQFASSRGAIPLSLPERIQNVIAQRLQPDRSPSTLVEPHGRRIPDICVPTTDIFRFVLRELGEAVVAPVVRCLGMKVSGVCWRELTLLQLISLCRSPNRLHAYGGVPRGHFSDAEVRFSPVRWGFSANAELDLQSGSPVGPNLGPNLRFRFKEVRFDVRRRLNVEPDARSQRNSLCEEHHTLNRR
jgi:hypothetical protein